MAEPDERDAPSPASSPSGGRSSSACARQGIEPFPHEFDGRTEIARGPRGARGPRRRRGDRRLVPGRRPDRGPPRPGQGRLHRPRRRAPASSSCTPARDVLGADEFDAPGRARPRRHRRGRGDRVQDPPRRALAGGDRLDAAGEEPAPAARQVPRPRGHRAPLPPARARPDREPRDARAVPQARRGRSRRPASTSTRRASSRSRRRSCSRSTAAPWRARSPPTTTRSTATSTCGSRPSST